MIRVTLAVALLTTLLFSGYCPAREQPLERQAPDLPPLTLPAVTTAVHAAAVLLDDSSQATVLDEAGCFVWQQPGVALVVTNMWLPGKQAELLFSPDKALAMLKALPGITPGEPIIHPQEQGNPDEFQLEPRVYVLDAAASQRRLATYRDNLRTWAGLNEGMEFILPDDAALASDIAIVYLDSGGPLEFHFQVGESGRLVLRHVVSYDFFSA